MFQLGCTVYPSVPEKPAFDTDVLPIFEAHCTRCHGSGPDGGTLQTVFIPGHGSGTGIVKTQTPCLRQFGNNPNSIDCAAGAGVGYVPPLIKQYIQPGFAMRMPPPPAPELNSWEMEVVNTWLDEADPANNVLPICSRSSNPDPALFCNNTM